MIEKILIPNYTTFQHDKETAVTYVVFPTDKETEFEDWCKKYNIGFGENNRKDIHKYNCGVVAEFDETSSYFSYEEK